jgi:hypothetical protein
LSRIAARVLLVIVACFAVLAGTVPGTAGRFSAAITNGPDTAKASTRFTCANTFAATNNAMNAYFEYQLTKNNPTAIDSSGQGNVGNLQPGGAHPVGTADTTTACPNDTGGPYYYAPDGSTNWISTTTSVGTTPANFTLAIWFRTTVAGGYLIGLNAKQTANDAVFDRHVYLDTSGHLVFGSYSGTYQTVATSSAFNDGHWHQVVATMSTAVGMALWVDGTKVVSNPTYTTAQADTGWWSIGYGNLSGWPSAPSNFYFSGGLRFAAAYRVVLSDAEIAAEYANGQPGA